MLSCIIYGTTTQKMPNLKKYIRTTLGTEINIKPFPKVKQKTLPFYIREMYKFKITRLFNREIIILVQKGSQNLTTDQYRKQITLIENTFDLPAVLILEQLEAYNRKRLLEKQIAFIIPGKQMYIPQLLIDLKDFRFATKIKMQRLQPAAQCLLLYHLLKKNVSDINFKIIAQRLNYSQMTITRAAANLNRLDLCTIEGNKEKKIVFQDDKRKIWETALPYLQNPVKRKVYTDKILGKNLIYKTGFTALAWYTNIAENGKTCFAISNVNYNYLLKNKEVHLTNNFEEDFCLEIWKYPPDILSNNNIVDPLSLFLIFKDTKDERIQMEIEKLIKKQW